MKHKSTSLELINKTQAVYGNTGRYWPKRHKSNILCAHINTKHCIKISLAINKTFFGISSALGANKLCIIHFVALLPKETGNGDFTYIEVKICKYDILQVN
jgi:hypothetical protein